MKQQLISEAQRMQKLAGMPISEMALPEMARTAGTGGAYTITEKGEEILKQTKAAGKAPEGIKNSEIAALVFLFKAKKDGKRVQKIDYATERNVPQPAVNPIFNSLEAKELVAREGYTSKQQEPKTSRPRPDINAVLGDLDIEEGQLNENEAQYYVHDTEGMEPPVGPFSLEKASYELLKLGKGWKIIDDETAKQIYSYLGEE
jgi:hypothetical protein